MSLRDWLSALFSTFTAPEFASLLSAQIDGSAVASLAADTVQVGGIEKAAESLALDQRAVAQAYLAFVCGSEDQMHHNYLKVVQAFEAYITQDWHIHVFRMLCSDLVMLSFLDPDPKTTLTNAVKTLDAFPRFGSVPEILKMRHSASPRGFSFFIPINASFKICFKLNELTRCPKIIEQVGQVLKNMQFSDFHRQDVVAFNFYLGRLKLIHHEFDAADQSLSMAWNLCPDEYSNQKRKILLYLTVTRLVLGKPPSFDLLQFYNLTDLFGDIILSIQQGNFAAFEYHVAQRQEWLMKYKCFGIIRYRTRVSVFRNLLRKMWQMQDSPRSISFNDFAVACQVSGLLEFTVDDAECTIQSLVDAGFVQGYINHGKRTVVVKGEVFPPMYPKY